jgi:2-C-methyl-D-erythritol 4-phosphate cytidylyltransferase
MKKYAVIVAGGTGTRMNAGIPKQFLMLKGKPVIWHTLQAFLNSYDDMQIVLVLPQAHLAKGAELVKAMREAERIKIVEGGETRFQSVKNGLKEISEPGIVFVHDGVRCLVTVDLIKRCYGQAMVKGSAIPAVAATDSMRIENAEGHQVIDRAIVRLIQTPQTFRSNILLPAFEQGYNERFTDEATVIEGTGQPIFLIEGEYNNIKVTHPIDLVIAEKIMEDLTA